MSFVSTILIMIYTVYILYSKKLSRFYVGHTSNLDNRLKEHNSGKSPYTSQGKYWTLVWSTSKDSVRLPEELEFKLKNLSRSRKIKFMKKYKDGIIDIAIIESIEQ